MNIERNRLKPKVVYLSFANVESGNLGDANNDRKLIDVIPPQFDIKILSPKRDQNQKLQFMSLVRTLLNILRAIVLGHRIFISRGHKLAFFPIITKKIFNNKVIVRLGCTPLTYVEEQAFSKNSKLKKISNISKRLESFFLLLVEKFSLRYSDQFIVENEKARKIAILYGAKDEKIITVPYYVQDYFLVGKNPSYNKDNEYFRIGYTGRFKNYDLIEPLIEALSYLVNNKKLVKLYLIGDGPNRKNIESNVKEKKLTNNTIFLGSLPHKDVSTAIDECHCLVLLMLNNICPSTIAIKILEGVMKGKIIITTNSGNNPSLFLKFKDLIIEELNSALLVKKITLVMKNYKKYTEIADRLKNYHLKLRSIRKNKIKIKELLKGMLE